MFYGLSCTAHVDLLVRKAPLCREAQLGNLTYVKGSLMKRLPQAFANCRLLARFRGMFGLPFQFALMSTKFANRELGNSQSPFSVTA